MGKLLVGAGKADITPKKKLLPMPFFLMLKFGGIADKIHVRALDIENGANRVLILTFDLVAIPNPTETMDYVCSLTGLNKDCVFMCATHSHTTPFGLSMPQTMQASQKNKKLTAWYKDILSAIKTAVQTAKKTTRPAKMGFGVGASHINANRDAVFLDGTSALGINYERPSDKTLNVLKFIDYQDKPIAYLINYAVHAVAVNGSFEKLKIKISGDIPGRTSLLIEKINPDSVCLWTSGAAGDQNPRAMSLYELRDEKGNVKVKTLGYRGFYLLDSLVEEHTRDILKTERNIACDKTEAEISTLREVVTCPGRHTAATVEEAKRTGQPLPEPVDAEYTLRLITIGDLAIQGISAEVVTSIGKAIKETSPYKNTMVITQTDYYTGYIPDEWEYEHNAFEAVGALVENGAAQPVFTECFANMFKRIKGDKQ